MAHFAELDENNIVIRVIVVSNADTSTEDGVENENLGIAFCKQLLGENTVWKQTSYNARFRYNYAGVGYHYNEVWDAFYPPQPYASWILNYDTFRWDPPIPMPNDGKLYSWDEQNKTWAEINLDPGYEVN